jgi:DNA-directed RNA polymerase subunit beta'
VLSRTGEARLLDKKFKKHLITNHIPYGAHLYIKDEQKVEKGDMICSWDPYNAVIVSEKDGYAEFENIIEGKTYREEIDEQTGHREKVIIESRDKSVNPVINITNKKGDKKSKKTLSSYNIPVGAHLSVDEGDEIESGQVLVKIPRVTGKLRDITGGLPRVTELFEARDPSNPAVIAEIDGIVSFGDVKRGNREITVESKDGEKKKYRVPLSKYILVQENDYVQAGSPLCDGAITPSDILSIKGPYALQEYLLNEIQEVYRLQGVEINDKHVETIIRQMMKKVEIEDPGDTRFLEGQSVNKFEFIEQNDWIYDKQVVTDPGDSNKFEAGQIVTLRDLREENSYLKRNDNKTVETRETVPATSSPMLQGITKASLGTESFISAASFQETTRVLSQASVAAKRDELRGLKENVIVGHKIPAGTGLDQFQDHVVGSKEEYEELLKKKDLPEDGEKAKKKDGQAKKKDKKKSDKKEKKDEKKDKKKKGKKKSKKKSSKKSKSKKKEKSKKKGGKKKSKKKGKKKSKKKSKKKKKKSERKTKEEGKKRYKKQENETGGGNDETAEERGSYEC